MPVARVEAVAPGSPADRAGVQRGDEVVTVNGERIRDIIRYRMQTDEPQVELQLARAGTEQRVTIGKRPGESLGLELQSAVFDRVQTCDNHCPFCFIHQLPSGMRRSLYLRDDDYRLSFLYGNFTTLTRFTEADFERVVTEGLSPLHVSIHATDPDVRTKLLRNRRGATSLRWLALLLDAGVEVHGQIVCCPGINDGAVLHDTLLGILDRFPKLATVGVVPLGVSAHNREPEMRPHTTAEAIAVLDAVEAWQSRARAALGRRLVHAADEYYLLAGRPFPALDHYDGCAQHENGIGMAATFRAEVHAANQGAPLARAPHSGFFASVDGAPAAGYRAPRTRAGAGAPASAPRDTWIVTGELGAPVLEPLLDDLTATAGAPVRLLPVRNEFFGGNIAVTGLLTGTDIAAAVAAVPSSDRVVLPDVVLSQDRFLDGTTLDDLGRAVDVVATDGAALVAALGRAGAAAP